jgi:hypothetical protein
MAQVESVTITYFRRMLAFSFFRKSISFSAGGISTWRSSVICL